MKRMHWEWNRTFVLILLALLGSTMFFAPAPARAAQTFNVKNFGATGNGVTNDTASILAALAAANAAPGSTLAFPSGNYLYSSILPATGISVVGRNATLTSTNDSSWLLLSGRRVSVQNMTFASQVANALAITVSQANGFQIANNSFSAGLGLDMVVTQSSNGQIQANTMLLSDKSSVLIMGDSSVISIQNNNVTSTSSTTSGFVIGSGNNISVINNRMNGVAGCIGLGDCQTVNVAHNVFANFINFGMTSGGDSNVTITDNQFTATVVFGSDLRLNVDANALISNNVFRNGSIGIQSDGTTGIQISGNTIDNMQFYGLLLNGDTTIMARGNTITRTGSAIRAGDERNLSVNGNQIAQCQNNGINATDCLGTETISNNEIRNCGLAVTNPAAVIFVDSAGASSIPITHNFYTGNTASLQFFIRCKQAQPPAKVSGNATNTGLPTVVGP